MNHDTDHPHTIVKSAFSFLSGTTLSRISGLARDMSIAFFFGTNSSIAALLVALKLANLLRRIFGEGALLNSFIPHFESYRNESPKRAAEFFRDTFFSLTILLIILITAIEVLLYYTTHIFTIEKENAQITHLIMIIMPGVLFICLSSICSGLLHCQKNFFLTGISPVAYNVIWIASIFVLKDYAPQNAVVGLSIGVIIAFLFQWLITFPKTISFLRSTLSWKELIKCNPLSPEIRSMMSSLSLGMIGVIAVQINTAVDSVFARYASLEGPAYLNYAIHLQQLPLALFGIGISSALLPPLSRAFKSDNLQKYTQLLEFSLSIALFIILPCTIAIFVLGGSSINLIFGRGDFNNESTVRTTLCLWGYGLGLIPMVITILLASAFYAKKNYRTPMIASLISISVNFILNILMVRVFHFGPESLAISTSIAAFCNAYLLYKHLHKQIGISFSSPFFHSLLKTIACASLTGVITLLICHFLFNNPTIPILIGEKVLFPREFIDQISQFLILSCTFILTFVVTSFAFNKKELMYLLRIRRLSKQD